MIAGSPDSDSSLGRSRGPTPGVSTMHQAGIKIHALVASLFLSSLSLVAAAAQTHTSGSALPVAYQRWLDEDVRYLISDQERSEFNQLLTDQQRDDFILAFWERRNPSPSSATN